MSTLHGFETGRQADKAMADWLKSLKDDEPQRIQSDTDRNKAEAKSLERKNNIFGNTPLITTTLMIGVQYS